MRRAPLALVGLVLIGCQPKSTPIVQDPQSSGAVAPVVESSSPETASMIDRIGKSYEMLARADGLYWAPWDCRAPPPAPAFASATTEGDHARKLYRLFLLEPDAYAAATDSKLPSAAAGFPGIGRPTYAARDAGIADQPWTVFGETDQVVVKESWKPNPCEHGQLVGGESHCLQTRGPLFVMAHPKASAGAGRATDAGWIYGTIVDRQVTASGVVASCVSCHAKAPHGRLFGLPHR